MSYRNSSPQEVRDLIRTEAITGQTAGMAMGFLQANLVILPEIFALDFARFCQRNPKPCPLVGISDTGNPRFTALGTDLNLVTDVPSYHIYQQGQLSETVTNLHTHWNDSFVSFALGCSHTFENALEQAGFSLWHVDNQTTVPMFKTAIDTVPSGPFYGAMVVTMRAIPDSRLEEVVEICRKYPLGHGAPVHIGNPATIGINSLDAPDWGDPAPLPKGYTPVFWACGVTPQVALCNAKLPLAITHKPGSMLITDIPDSTEIPILGQEFPLSF
jgi:uncharacterized protein YcsI (UPF0317 family)